jgi:hypothetical protein
MNQWTQTYRAYFQDERSPQDVRFSLEKRLQTLLEIDAQSTPLVYRGEYAKNLDGLFGRIELCFEAPGLYSLSFDAARDRDYLGHLPPKDGSKFSEVGILDEPRFLADSQKLFQAWCSILTVAKDPGPKANLRGADYMETVRQAVEWDAKRAAAMREDPRSVAEAQQFVLDLLAAGKRFRVAHKEGLSSIQMEEGALVRRETGEYESQETFRTREEMLDFLRSHFFWEATKDTRPHKPPEAEIWKFIAGKFE